MEQSLVPELLVSFHPNTNALGCQGVREKQACKCIDSSQNYYQQNKQY